MGEIYNGNDTHFAVNKKTNLIVFAWNYSDVDNDELRQFKKDYFIEDIVNNGFNPNEYTVLTFNSCRRRGIDPNNDSNWSNDGITPCTDVNCGITDKQIDEAVSLAITRLLG